VRTGRIAPARLDSSVRKVLALKQRLGLFRRRTVNLDSVGYVVSRQSSVEAAAAAARRSLVLVKDSLSLVESLFHAPRRLVLVAYAEGGAGHGFPTLAAELRAQGHQLTVHRLFPASGPASYDSARVAVSEADAAVFAVAIRAREGAGSVSMPAPLAGVIESASARSLLVSFGSPYLIAQVPSVASYLIAWTVTNHAERAVANALHGAPVTGRLPVAIPPSYRIGDGIMAGGRILNGPPDLRLPK
jgi:beta-N-acetylhexosaminidase